MVSFEVWNESNPKASRTTNPILKTRLSARLLWGRKWRGRMGVSFYRRCSVIGFAYRWLPLSLGNKVLVLNVNLRNGNHGAYGGERQTSMIWIALLGLGLSTVGWWMPWITESDMMGYSGSYVLRRIALSSSGADRFHPLAHTYLLLLCFLAVAALLLWAGRSKTTTPLTVAAPLTLVITLIEAVFVVGAVAWRISVGGAWYDVEWQVGTFLMIFGQAFLICGVFAAWIEGRVEEHQPRFEFEQMQRRVRELEGQLRAKEGVNVSGN